MKEVQAIYIALPNHLHAGYTVRAAQAAMNITLPACMAGVSIGRQSPGRNNIR
jgi:hypothetical protein